MTLFSILSCSFRVSIFYCFSTPLISTSQGFLLAFYGSISQNFCYSFVIVQVHALTFQLKSRAMLEFSRQRLFFLNASFEIHFLSILFSLFILQGPQFSLSTKSFKKKDLRFFHPTRNLAAARCLFQIAVLQFFFLMTKFINLSEFEQRSLFPYN